MKGKTPLSHEVVCFQMLDFDNSKSISEVSKSNSWKITSFSKLRSIRGNLSDDVLYYQQVSINRYQVSFYVKNYFE